MAAEIEQGGADAKAYVVDLADADAIDPLVKTILGEFGRIDILVNCAGVTGGGRHSVLDFSASCTTRSWASIFERRSS